MSLFVFSLNVSLSLSLSLSLDSSRPERSAYGAREKCSFSFPDPVGRAKLAMRPKVKATATSWRFLWGGRRAGQRDRAFLFFFGVRLDGKRHTHTHTHTHTQDAWEDLRGRHATSFSRPRCALRPAPPVGPDAAFRCRRAPPSFFFQNKRRPVIGSSRGPSRRINTRQQK
nr:hypothetical protein [Pandoravirus belohorizontensis]